MPVYRVMVVDDELAFRQMARHLLEQGEEFRVVGEAASGEEAVRLAVGLHPDLVLMDVHLGGMGGFEATRQLLARRPEIKVVLLSMWDEREYHRLAARAWASAFIPKRDFSLKALRQVLAGGTGAELEAPA